MDPLSATATAIQLLGTIKSCVAVLRLYYSRASAAGEALQERYLDFSVCQTSLESWIGFWELERSSSRHQDKLWGRDGRKRIMEQLALTLQRMDDVWTKLAPMVAETGIDGDDVGAGNGDEIDRQAINLLREGAKRAQRKLSIWSKWRAARGKIEDLQTLLVEVDGSVQKLCSKAMEFFNSRHRIFPGSGDTAAAAVKQSRMDAFVGAVIHSRTAAAWLLDGLKPAVEEIRRALQRRSSQAALHGPDVAFQMKLDVVNWQVYLRKNALGVYNEIPLRYYFSIFDRGGHAAKHMMAKGPLPSPDSDDLAEATKNPAPGHAIAGIDSGLRAAAERETRLFRVSDGASDSTVAESFLFQVLPVHPPSDFIFSPTARAQHQKTAVRDLLRLGSLPQSHRILLAHRLVSAALFLAGTGWLGRDVHTGRLWRFDNDDDDDDDDESADPARRPRFVLDVPPASLGGEDGKDGAAIAAYASGNPALLASGLEHVGRVLVELGLDAVEPSPAKGGGARMELMVTAAGKGSGSWLAGLKLLLAMLFATLLRFTGLGMLVGLLHGEQHRAAYTVHVEQIDHLSPTDVYEKLTEAMGEAYAATVRYLCVEAPAGSRIRSEEKEQLLANLLTGCWKEACFRMQDLADDVEAELEVT